MKSLLPPIPNYGRTNASSTSGHTVEVGLPTLFRACWGKLSSKRYDRTMVQSRMLCLLQGSTLKAVAVSVVVWDGQTEWMNSLEHS